MNCPKCEGQTGVLDSRPECDCVRRRRRCLVCGYRFSTIELEEDMKLMRPKKKRLVIEYDPMTEVLTVLKEENR